VSLRRPPRAVSGHVFWPQPRGWPESKCRNHKGYEPGPCSLLAVAAFVARKPSFAQERGRHDVARGVRPARRLDQMPISLFAVAGFVARNARGENGAARSRATKNHCCGKINVPYANGCAGTSPGTGSTWTRSSTRPRPRRPRGPRRRHRRCSARRKSRRALRAGSTKPR